MTANTGALGRGRIGQMCEGRIPIVVESELEGARDVFHTL